MQLFRYICERTRSPQYTTPTRYQENRSYNIVFRKTAACSKRPDYVQHLSLKPSWPFGDPPPSAFAFPSSLPPRLPPTRYQSADELVQTAVGQVHAIRRDSPSVIHTNATRCIKLTLTGTEGIASCCNAASSASMESSSSGDSLDMSASSISCREQSQSSRSTDTNPAPGEAEIRTR